MYFTAGAESFRLVVFSCRDFVFWTDEGIFLVEKDTSSIWTDFYLLKKISLPNDILQIDRVHVSMCFWTVDIIYKRFQLEQQKSIFLIRAFQTTFLSISKLYCENIWNFWQVTTESFLIYTKIAMDWQTSCQRN